MLAAARILKNSWQGFVQAGETPALQTATASSLRNKRNIEQCRVSKVVMTA